MAAKKVYQAMCIYCYKPAIENDETKNQENRHKLFMNQLVRHLKINDNTSTLYIVQCTNYCNDCLGIVEKFCELYHQIKRLELQLNWQIDKLRNVMRWADRVPSRLKAFRNTEQFDDKQKFRRYLRRSFKTNLSNSFPRVALSVLNSARVSKLENMLADNHDEIDGGNAPENGENNDTNINELCDENLENRTNYFLVGWITTLSAVIFLYHLELKRLPKARPESLVESELIPPVPEQQSTNNEVLSVVSTASLRPPKLASPAPCSDNEENDNEDCQLKSPAHSETSSISSSDNDEQVFTNKESVRCIIKVKVQLPEQEETISQAHEEFTDTDDPLQTVTSPVYVPNEYPLEQDENHSKYEVPVVIFDRQMTGDPGAVVKSGPCGSWSDISTSPLDSLFGLLKSGNPRSIPGLLPLPTSNIPQPTIIVPLKLIPTVPTNQSLESTLPEPGMSGIGNGSDINTGPLESLFGVLQSGNVRPIPDPLPPPTIIVPLKPPPVFPPMQDLESVPTQPGPPGSGNQQSLGALERLERALQYGDLSLSPQSNQSPCNSNYKPTEPTKVVPLNPTLDLRSKKRQMSSNVEVGRRKLRTKYQCSKCKATFSDVRRFEAHTQICSQPNEPESEDSNDEDEKIKVADIQNKREIGSACHSLEGGGDGGVDPVSKMTIKKRRTGTKYVYDDDEDDDWTDPGNETEFEELDEMHSGDEEGSQPEPKHEVNPSNTNFGERGPAVCRPKVTYPSKSTRDFGVKCEKCTPSRWFPKASLLLNHERYKHTNGQYVIGGQKVLKEHLECLKVEGISMKTKHSCHEEGCTKTFILPEELENHSKFHGTFTCHICDVKLNYAMHLVYHELEHTDDKQLLENENYIKEEIFSCSRCDFKSNHKTEFLNHYLVDHLELRTIQSKCPICKQTFPNVEKVSVAHYLDCHDLNRLDDPENRVKCSEPTCSAYFLTEDQLHLHWNRQHNAGHTSAESQICILEQTAKNRTALDQMKCRVKTWSCPHCPKKFAYSGGLRMHAARCYRKKSNLSTEKVVICKDGTTVSDLVNEKNAKYFCKKDKCREKFREEDDFETHSKLHGEFPCNFCEVVKQFAPDLAFHELGHVKVSNGDKIKRNSIGKVFKCSRCPFEIGRRGRFLNHFVRRHLGLQVAWKKCPICKYAFVFDTYMKNDLKHLKDGAFKHFIKWHDFTEMEGGDKYAERCDSCPAYFRTKVQLLYHSEEVHNTSASKYEEDGGLVCQTCGKDMCNTKDLMSHRKNIHKIDLKFVCQFPNCEKKYETPKQLLNHDTLCHGDDKQGFICSLCGKSFNTKIGLKGHMRSHEPKKNSTRTHVCEQCGKAFKQKHMLEIHSKFHEGPNSWEFSCETCGKKIFSQQKLTEHMRVHTKEKPFVCQVCGIAYSHRHNLRIHVNSKHAEVQDTARKVDATNFASWRKGKKLK